MRGLASGVGSNDRVSSPSFTLSNQYSGNGLTIYHFDFYRIDDPGIMRQDLREILEDNKAVVAIEWAGLVSDILPAKHLSVTINITGEDERQLIMEYPEELSYLFPDNT